MTNPRSLFLPKLPELKEQCPSCPFRDGNDAEFGAIVQKFASLQAHRHIDGEDLRAETLVARARVKADVEQMGDFHCHCTAYDDEMNVKPLSEHRQCPGATRYFVEAGEGAAE